MKGMHEYICAGDLGDVLLRLEMFGLLLTFHTGLIFHVSHFGSFYVPD